MIRVLVKITYEYTYVDNKDGIYEDIMYMPKNNFINYDDFDYCKRIIHCYLNELDKSRTVNKIKSIEQLGERLYD